MTDGDSGALVIDKDRFLLLHVLTSAAPRNIRLASIAELLKAVVRSVRAVVKGTDSQRRFNAQLAEFCRALVLTLPEVEDAVFELTHPGRRAAEATDDEVQGITEGTLLKELAAYLATQTSNLGARYLEHIALTSLQGSAATVNTQQCGATSASASPGGKRERMDAATTGRVAVTMAGSSSGQGGRLRHTKHYVATTATGSATASAVDEEQDALGLLDEDDMTRAARRQLRLDAQSTICSAAQQQPRRLERGLFVSDKAAVSGGGKAAVPERGVMGAGRVFDLRLPAQKLSPIPELLPRLQPWTIPVPLSGVMLDRLTTERERRGMTVTACATSQGVTPPAGAHAVRVSNATRESRPPPAAPALTIFDVCLAANPAELLRAWERREAALTACRAQHTNNDACADGTADVVTRATAASLDADRRALPHTAQDSGNATSLPSPPLSTASALPPSTMSAPSTPDFFPRLPSHDGGGTVSVPTSLMTNLVHFGIASIDFT